MLYAIYFSKPSSLGVKLCESLPVYNGKKAITNAMVAFVSTGVCICLEMFILVTVQTDSRFTGLQVHGQDLGYFKPDAGNLPRSHQCIEVNRGQGIREIPEINDKIIRGSSGHVRHLAFCNWTIVTYDTSGAIVPSRAALLREPSNTLISVEWTKNRICSCGSLVWVYMAGLIS